MGAFSLRIPVSLFAHSLVCSMCCVFHAGGLCAVLKTPTTEPGIIVRMTGHERWGTKVVSGSLQWLDTTIFFAIRVPWKRNRNGNSAPSAKFVLYFVPNRLPLWRFPGDARRSHGMVWYGMAWQHCCQSAAGSFPLDLAVPVTGPFHSTTDFACLPTLSVFSSVAFEV